MVVDVRGMWIGRRIWIYGLAFHDTGAGGVRGKMAAVYSENGRARGCKRRDPGERRGGYVRDGIMVVYEVIFWDTFKKISINCS